MRMGLFHVDDDKNFLKNEQHLKKVYWTPRDLATLLLLQYYLNS